MGSASLLAGRVTRVSPNYPLVRGICSSLEHQDPEALSGALRRQNFPSTGGSAIPALGAMQEPIPDCIKNSQLETNPCSLDSQGTRPETQVTRYVIRIQMCVHNCRASL